MKFLYSFLPVLILFGIGNFALAQPQQRCFVNVGLKDEDRVYLTIDEAKVAGEFVIERGYDAANRETYAFSGTKSGNNLTIRFVRGKAPDALPQNLEDFVWTLITTSGSESLRVQFYGKDYTTNKYAVYAANFESCEPGYAALARTAQRVAFAKGTSSARVAVALTAKTERRTFLLNLGKGQAASVQAIGCGISFYYPDKTQYEEGTAIDSWSSKALAQSGDYLFMISSAGSMETCTVTFSAN